jgi:uncharacterized protein YjbI with pentapeptide repeats
LISRWATPEGRTLALDAAFRLVSGEMFEGSEFGVFEGRTDLRGLQLPKPDQVGKIKVGEYRALILDGTIMVRDAVWNDIDLSHADLGHLRFTKSQIENCVFERASCLDWRLWDSAVSRTSFLGADLRGAAVGTWYEDKFNTWNEVIFDRADLRGAMARTARFSSCSFRNTRFMGMKFTRCALDSVVFEGKLQDVIFIGGAADGDPDVGPLRNVDFSKAEFDRVSFRDILFENVTMPDDPDVILISDYRKVARRELHLLSGDVSAEATVLRSTLEDELAFPMRESLSNVFNRRDYAGFDRELSDLIESTVLQAKRDVEAGWEEPTQS